MSWLDMGDSGCLMHSSFSYNNHLQRNHVHTLGDSVSFGRFTPESLGCEKWSSVPQKRYVEEAKSYTQPGSVAAKKAFFEAYYKRIAAQKAAAEALLEQEKAAAAAAAAAKAHEISNIIQSTFDSKAIDINIVAATKDAESLNSIENLEDRVSVSVDSRTSQTQRPLLKSKSNTDEEVTQPMIKRKPAISSLLSSIGRKPTATRIPPSPSKYAASAHHKKYNIGTPRTKNVITNDHIDKKRSTPAKALMTSRNVRESCKLTSPSVQKSQSKKLFPSIRTTPMKTPSKAFINGVYKQPLATPSSANKRMETPVHPTAAGSKSTGPKWPIISAVSKSLSSYKNKLQSPTILSPFVLRTEERAARRKQKLEEKFNEKAQHMQEHAKLKDKAETEFRKLRQSFCFKARPLPDFYKTPEENPKSFTPRRAAPSFSPSLKKKSSRRLWKNPDQNLTYHTFSSVAGMTSHDGMSQNIRRLPINMHK